MSKEFGKRLKAERERLGLTQPQFAELGGVKRATQHLYEQDATCPDVDYLLRLDKAGVDVVFLLFGETRKGVGSAGISVAPEMLSQIFRAVDEFGTDDVGHALSPGVREKFFLMLTAAVTQGGANANPNLIQQEMARLLGRAA
jgi:transcriptional regulator with XRE-family HTH domain